MIKVYGDRRSGNCYKIELCCHLLGIQYQWQNLDILQGETQTDEFKAKNPNAKIPLLALEDGRTLSESNAIINYLAYDSELLPRDSFALAKVQQWQFFEQYSHEPFIAVARFINKYLNLPEARKQEYSEKQIGGNKALSIMDAQLATSRYLVGDDISTADIALFAYTHVAEEGGFNLQQYPNIQRWVGDIQALENFVAMEKID